MSVARSGGSNLVLPDGVFRPVWAEIDLAAVRHNAAVLRQIAAPAALCAVVKADGYGHGAVAVARAALEGGATWLAVALVEEGIVLREAGITAPVLLLSEPSPAAMDAAVRAGLTPTVYTLSGVAAAASAAVRHDRPVDVHVKVNTGMHRVGADPDSVMEVIDALRASNGLRLQGLWTHLAVANETTAESHRFTKEQLARLDRVLARVAGTGAEALLVHAANSAAIVAFPEARHDVVRSGIALYGQASSPALERQGLRPVLSLRAQVSFVRRLDAGERPSYGRRRPLAVPSVVATVPIGYADGVARRLFDAGIEVLIGGRRRPLAGAVTMDQILVDCGPDGDVLPGDEVVLLGRQGDEEVTVAEWAAALGTISYEVLCGIGARVPRVPV